MLKEIDRFLSSELSIDLEKAIQQEAECSSIEESKITRNHKTRGKRKRDTDSAKRKARDNIAKDRKAFEGCRNTERILSEERTGHQENKRVKLEKEKQKEAFEDKQQEIGKEHGNNAELQTQWNQTYLEWKLKTEQNIKEIAIFIEGAVFPTDEKAEQM